MTDKVRIGAVCFLNTEPLVYGLKRGAGSRRIELSDDVPSKLAERMRRGELEIALLPVIELARIPDLELVPGLAIRTFGPSRSVLLVCRRPVSSVTRVALDPESRSSNALARVLLHEVWGREPQCEIGPGELGPALERYDAVVRIGDKALFEAVPTGTEVHDLGEVWTRATGLPFVFAAWTARPGVVDRELYTLLHDSRRDGARAIDSIAREYSWRGRRDPALVRAYLMEHIRYRLGAVEIRAMRHFFEAAERLGLIERVPEIRLALPHWTACHETAARGTTVAAAARLEKVEEPHD